jgi:transposase
MRGRVDPQESMFSYFSPDSRVPEDHPLRRIKLHADVVLASMNPEFDRIYAEIGRPSIPPERLLKASLLIALYSVRSDRLFCEMLDYNLLFRWFLDMSLDQPGLDQSNFSRLRERLVGQDTARIFFDAVVSEARKAGLLSDEHFTGRRHPDRSLGEPEELQAQGRSALGGRRRRWDGRLPRPAAQQRHARLHHR